MLDWYVRFRRPLPWRATSDPYRIWVSEVMLQQTRAVAVIPYYERFLARFPDLRSLAEAPEPELLAAWAGLGYYSRVRNLQKAAREVLAAGGRFPGEYERIRALPGIGDYTAAAVASIAFGLPYPVLDGNVVRVLARITSEAGDVKAQVTRHRLQEAAERLLDVRRPGDFNQALMELGATICLPRRPACPDCPVATCCQARAAGIEEQLPMKRGGRASLRLTRTILLIQRGEAVLLRQRPAGEPKLAGFWELPEEVQIPAARLGATVCTFRHTITHHIYQVQVRRAAIARAPKAFRWVERSSLCELPLTTETRKALQGSHK